MSHQDLFKSLHSEYSSMITQMCLGFMKGDAHMANGLTQEVFINVWNGLNKYRGEASYKTWIYRITVNTCLQHIRKEKVKPVTGDVEAIERADDHSSEKAEQAYKNLYAAIGQLAELDRLIIMMVLDELEYDEIARITGISSINLRVKIHRIKSRLKKIMDNEYRNG